VDDSRHHCEKQIDASRHFDEARRRNTGTQPRARRREREGRVRESPRRWGDRAREKMSASILCRGLSFHFRAHDLRRTASTGMAEAGVPRDHIAKVLNHIEGGPSATRIYDRYAYDKESATRSNAGRGGYRLSSRARSERSFRSRAKPRALAENRPLTVSVGSCFPVDRRLPGTFWRAPVRQSAGYDPDREAPIRGASGSR
jgi:integrase